MTSQELRPVVRPLDLIRDSSTIASLDDVCPLLPFVPETPSWVSGVFLHEELCGLVMGTCATDRADAAVFVASEFRGRGLETLLIEVACVWGKMQHANALRLTFARSDMSMRRFISKFRPRLDLHFDQLVAEIALAPSTPIAVGIDGWPCPQDRSLFSISPEAHDESR